MQTMEYHYLQWIPHTTLFKHEEEDLVVHNGRTKNIKLRIFQEVRKEYSISPTLSNIYTVLYRLYRLSMEVRSKSWNAYT